MTIHTLEPILRAHPFFAGLDPAHLDFIAGCGRNTRFAAGDIIFAEGQPADSFYIIRSGRVALDLAAPGRRAAVLQTLDEGDVLGWSWLLPPHKWAYTARAIQPTRAVAMDATCLRKKCEEDTALGYELMKRFAGVIVERLQDARMRILDVYGHADADRQ